MLIILTQLRLQTNSTNILNPAKGIQKNDTIPFENYLKGNYRESMFTEPVAEYEMLTEIDKLNVTRSAGHDNISAKMVNAIKQEICKPLIHIFNLNFETGNNTEYTKNRSFLKLMKNVCLKL